MTEIAAAAIIIALLAAIAVPEYAFVVERFRTDQAKQILRDIYAAQKRYYVEKEQYANSIALLDINLPAATTHFSTATATTPGASGTIGSISTLPSRKTNYTLEISTSGTITCSSSSMNLCRKLGFN